MVLISEQRIKVQDFQERFKLAVVSADPDRWGPLLYPSQGDSKGPDDDYDIDQTDVQWVMPDITEEEVQRMLDEYRQQGGGTITLDDVDDWE